MIKDALWNKKSLTPDPDKLIECRGNDWCDFLCLGKMVPYKGKPINGKKERFCIYDQKLNIFTSDRETWSDVTEWRYVNGEELERGE